MTDPENPSPPDEREPLPDLGPERRSGCERRQDRTPQPPPGLPERRTHVRRKADRLALEGDIRVGLAAGGRLYPRAPIAVPVFYRPLSTGFVVDQPARRGMTCALAPGGLGLLLAEEVPAGACLELLVQLDADLLGVDAQVMSVVPQGEKFLHNCRFTRLGPADRNWLIEYLRRWGGPPK